MLILEQFDSWLFNDPSISHNGTSEPLLTLAQRVVSSLILISRVTSLQPANASHTLWSNNWVRLWQTT